MTAENHSRFYERVSRYEERNNEPGWRARAASIAAVARESVFLIREPNLVGLGTLFCNLWKLN